MISGLEKKLEQAVDTLRKNRPVLVAYSGGVDSSVLLALAHRNLGGEVVGVIADSPSLPRSALSAALLQAASIGVRVETLNTRELEDPDYASNPLNRCYFCKAELFRRMEEMAQERGFQGLAYGENADDPPGQRPGSQAAKEFRVMAPLREAGLGKKAIREIARSWGLSSADLPAMPCLSSRIPHGTPVTPEALQLVEKGEDILRQEGFSVFRVRYRPSATGEVSAWVQFGPEDLLRAGKMREKIFQGMQKAGFSHAEIDPDGYRGMLL
jgi:uncharacterized protein